MTTLGWRGGGQSLVRDGDYDEDED